MTPHLQGYMKDRGRFMKDVGSEKTPLIGSILLPLVLLRSFKGVLIALQFRHKAEEGKLVSK